MTYSYVYHLQKPTSGKICYACTQRINFSMRPQHVRMTRDPLSFAASFLENPCEYPHKLYCQKLVHELL